MTPGIAKVGIMISKIIPKSSTILPFHFIFSRFLHKDRAWLDLDRIKEVSDAVSLFRDMLIMKPLPSVVQFTKLMSLVVKMKQYSVALNMFDEMRKSRVPFDKYTLNIIINCNCLLNRANLGFATLDILTYNCLMDEHCRKGDVDEAWKLFLDIPRLGLAYTVFSYNIMLNGLLRVGRIADGWNLFNEMKVHSVIPDVVTYSSLIDGLCRNQQIDEAFSVLCMMEDNGVNPDMVTYDILIHGLCKDGKFSRAMDLFCSLPSKGLKPDVIMFTNVIDALCQQGLFSEANQMFMDMQHRGCAPDSRAYNVIVKGCLMQNKFFEAQQLMEEMVKKGFSLEDSVISMLLNLLQDNGQDVVPVDMITKLVRTDN